MNPLECDDLHYIRFLIASQWVFTCQTSLDFPLHGGQAQRWRCG